MQTRALGAHGPQVSAIGFGAWAMGGRGWGEVDDQETMAAVRRSIDLGSTFVDTAERYGDGHSEELIGQALEGRRDQVFLATKVAGIDLSRTRSWRPSTPPCAGCAPSTWTSINSTGRTRRRR